MRPKGESENHALGRISPRGKCSCFVSRETSDEHDFPVLRGLSPYCIEIMGLSGRASGCRRGVEGASSRGTGEAVAHNPAVETGENGVKMIKNRHVFARI